MAQNLVPIPKSFVPFGRRDLETSIPSRFERLAAQSPERVAIKSRTQSLSYGDLNAVAGQVTDAIRAVVDPAPQPIALLLGSGADLIVAILAVLKAGHFYVPLDVGYPEAALRALLVDSGARLILTDAAWLPLARRLSQTLPPIDLGHLPTPTGPGRHERHIAADDLAYIYYTSGSTGRPKGVMDTHRNVLHNIMRYTNGLHIAPGDRLTLLQSPMFSGAVSSLFGALLNGASVFPYDVRQDGVRGIGPWLLEERITIYHSVPALFRHFLRAAREDQSYPTVRVVRLEGDRASPSELDLFRKHFADEAVLAHGLGATECGLVRRLVLDKFTEIAGPIVPIGYAIEDMTVRILDAGGCERATGDIGEIAIESRYLSPGYWKRPDLTEKAFSAGLAPGTRRYRTGDVGRLRPDGCLEHLGRTNSQPRLRGQRVEVEAIEAALLKIELVAEAVVEVRNGPFDEGRLVAYVVPLTKGKPTATLLRRRLAQALPPQLVPARFVILEALPLTANQKVDRTALPDPDRERPQLDGPYIAPGNDLERGIASIFGHALGLDQVGVRDDFFELGGDSLGAMLVLERLSQQYGVELSSHSLFEAPSVEGLVRLIAAARSPSASGSAAAGSRACPRGSPLVAIQPEGTRPPFFFLHAEYGGDGFYCLNLARHLGADQPFFGLSPHGRDGGPMPVAIETMAAAYIEAIREVQAHGPYRLGGFCSSAVVAWEMGRQLLAAGESVDLLVVIELPAVRRRGWWRGLYRLIAIGVAIGGGGPEKRLALMTAAARWVRRVAHFQLRDVRRCWEWLTRRAGDHAPRRADEQRGVRIAECYHRAVNGYLPARFDGPVLCLRASEEAGWSSVDEWRRLAPEFTERLIPGDHDSCIIMHSRTIAEHLGAPLAGGKWR